MLQNITNSPLFQKTFGGLTKEYYFRQFVFGAIMALAMIFIPHIGEEDWDVHYNFVFSVAICTVLYPYSRFVYESIVNFLIGNNLFILPAVILLMWKLFTMLFCFMMSPIIAPIGLIGLYIYLTRLENSTKGSQENQ